MPQYAKDVLVDPVLLLIDKYKVLVIFAPAVHVPQASSPGLGGSVAATNNKSPDVHELAGGSVCADTVEKNKTAGKKISIKYLMDAVNQATG